MVQRMVTLKKSMMYATCQDDCFSVEGTNKLELAQILKAHLHKQHGVEISDAEAERSVHLC
jgi:hypothetical protein